MSEMTLLLVDDAATDRLAFRRFLRRTPHSPEAWTYRFIDFECGEEALDYCRQHTFDLILLDYNLPDLNALEFLAALRALMPEESLPVLVLTGQGNEQMASESIKSGAQDYLSKENLTSEALNRSVTHALSQVRLQQELRLKKQQKQLMMGILLRLRRSLGLAEILDGAVQELLDFLKIDRVLIYQTRPHGGGKVRSMALCRTVDRPPIAETLLPWAAFGGGEGNQTCPVFFHWERSSTPEEKTLWVQHLHAWGVQQLTSFPLWIQTYHQQDLLWGWLVLHQCQECAPWEPWQQEMLMEFSTHLAIAIQQAELYQSVQQLNQNLTQTVAAQERALTQMEIQLHGIIDRLPVVLFAIDAQGIFTLSEGHGLRLLGWEPGQVVGHSVFDIYADHPSVLQKIHETLQGQATNWLDSFNGTILEAWTSPIWDAQQRVQGLMGVAIDVTERVETERSLESLMIGTAASSGQDFFEQCVRSLASALKVSHALISELRGNRLYVLAYWAQDRWLAPLAYDLSEAPACAQVIDRGMYWCDGTFQDLPLAPMFRVLNLDTYMGVRLEDEEGKPLGTLCVLNKEPLQRSSWCGKVLHIFAARSSAEIKRRQAEEALQTLNQELEARVQERTASLERSQSQLRHLADNFPGVIYQFALDAQGNPSFPFVSEGALDLLGESPETLMNDVQKGFARIYPTDLPKLWQSIEHSARFLSPWHWQGRVIHDDGVVVWLQCVSQPTLQENGTILWDGVMVDMTEQKKAQESLQQSEARFRQLAETIESVFWMRDRQSPDRFLYISPAYERIWGRSPVPLLHDSRHWLTAIVPEDHRLVVQTLSSLYQTGQGFHIQYRIQRPDGEVRWIRERAFPVNPKGSTVGDRLVGIAEDITNEKRKEEELLRTQTLREAIFNEATDALFLVSPITQLIIDCNQRAVELFEAWDKDDLIGIEGNVLQKRQFTSSELEDIGKTLKRRGVWSAELEYITHRGREFWGNLAAKVLQLGDQNLHLVRLTDITPQKEAEENIRRSLAKEKELNELKSHLLSMTSHEFRTPLTVIASSASILERFTEKLTPDRREHHLRTIQTYVTHITALLDDVLTLNRSEKHKLQFEPQRVNVVKLFHDLVQEMGWSHPQSQIRLRVFHSAPMAEDDTEGDRHMAHIDSKLLRQILSNLLSNAIKYSNHYSHLSPNTSPNTSPKYFTDRPPVAVRLYLMPERVMFSVRDWGRGIPLEEQQRLFEPFFRASNVGHEEGTGLGLSVVKSCVEQHQGQVAALSRPQRGSLFVVKLPRYVPLTDAVDSATPALGLMAGGSPQPVES